MPQSQDGGLMGRHIRASLGLRHRKVQGRLHATSTPPEASFQRWSTAGGSPTSARRGGNDPDMRASWCVPHPVSGCFLRAQAAGGTPMLQTSECGSVGRRGRPELWHGLEQRNTELGSLTSALAQLCPESGRRHLRLCHNASLRFGCARLSLYSCSASATAELTGQ